MPTAKKKPTQADDEVAVKEKIAAMREPFNQIGERLHEIILRSDPALKPKVWYGMPGYAKDGPVLCFFRVDDYMTFGLTEKANFSLEDDATDKLMPSSWFFTELDDATAEKIATLVRKAVS